MRALRKSELPARQVRIRKVHSPALSEERDDFVAIEEPLEIRVRGEAIAVTMRTPGHDAELAAGFLFTEGLLREPSSVIRIAHCRQGDVPARQNILNVYLRPTTAFVPPSPRGPVNVSCGLCGKSSIEAVHRNFPPLATSVSASPAVLASLPDKLAETQAAFASTGGLHAAAIFDLSGSLLVAREDIGRHNAVDKVIGHAFLKSLLPLDKSILLVSGRSSFEIVQKALAARIPIIASVSAPSSLAVEFANENGQSLIGFLRGNTMNDYSPGSRPRAAS